MNTSVEPVGGSTMALWIRYAPINEETTISAQPKTAEENRPDNAADDENDRGGPRILDKERDGSRAGEFSTR